MKQHLLYSLLCIILCTLSSIAGETRLKQNVRVEETDDKENEDEDLDEADIEAQEEAQKRDDCNPKKKIILFLDHGGLGNRMLATASIALLAVKMDRIFELRWVKDHSLQEDYAALFQTPPVPPYPDLKPFLFWGEEPISKSKNINQRYCRLLFNAETDEKDELPYHHFNVLKDPELFHRINTVCDVITIDTNLWHGHLILGPQFGKGSQHMLATYQKPFHDMAKILFKPNAQVLKRAYAVTDLMKNDKGGPVKWMSIQARELFTEEWETKSGGQLGQAFACANKLLEEKTISYVFFAADSIPMRNAAKRLISDQKFLKTLDDTENLGKDIVSHSYSKGENDNYEIRHSHGVFTALTEWYIVGEADYCLSPSAEHSTFSKTAIARGNCMYLNFREGKDCKVENVWEDKEKLLSTRVFGHPYFYVPKVDSDTVFDSIKIYKHQSNEQCTTKDTDAKAVFNYWNPNNNKRNGP